MTDTYFKMLKYFVSSAIITGIFTIASPANAVCVLGYGSSCRLIKACERMNAQTKLQRNCSCVVKTLESGLFSNSDVNVFVKLMEHPLDKKYQNSITKHWGLMAGPKVMSFIGGLGPCERH